MADRAQGIGVGMMPAVNVCAGCRVDGFGAHHCDGVACVCSVDASCAGFVAGWDESERRRARAEAARRLQPFFSRL